MTGLFQGNKLDCFEDFGRLLLGAGVSSDRVERLVARMVAEETAQLRQHILLETHMLIGDELDRLNHRHRENSIETRRLIGRMEHELRHYRQTLARQGRIGTGIAFLMVQSVLMIILLAALLFRTGPAVAS